MIIRSSTNQNDWTFGKGLSDYYRDQNAIIHNIRTRLLSWREDCFFAPAEGIDYNNFLDIGTKDLLDSDIKRVVLQSEGVVRINQYESTLERETRDFSANITVTTIFGTGLLDFNLNLLS